MDCSLHNVHDADKLFYYFNSENESNNLVLRIVLCDKVDKFILKKALNKALERYPNFRQTPVLDARGYLYTRDNDREADVYPYEPDPVNLGTEDTNGYLFRVMYEGNTLWLSTFHALCDGRGYMMFARTLLYYYVTFSGYPVGNAEERILTHEVPVDSSERKDPYDIKTDGKPAPNPYKPTGEENIFILPEMVKETDECQHQGLFRYVLDTERLVALAKEAGTTVDTYVHLLIARGIHDGFDTGGRIISGIGTVDLRPYYGSRYLQNMTDLFWVYYEDAFFNLSDHEACDIIQRLFKGPQLTRENFDGTRLHSKAHFREMFGFPYTNAQGLRAMRDAFWTSPDLFATYFMTNLVRFELGEELDPFVEQADIYGPDIFRCPVIFLLTHGNKTTVNITQRSFNRQFPLKMREEFIGKGLLVSDEMGCSFESDKIRVDLIPVVS